MIERIAIEEVFELQRRRKEINSFLLRDIIWTREGNPITPNRRRIDNWDLTGLTNMDYVLSGEAEKE